GECRPLAARTVAREGVHPLPALRVRGHRGSESLRLDSLQGTLSLPDLPRAVRVLQVHLSFHPLRLVAREPAAADAVCLTLEVPAALRSEYEFEPGQHVAMRATLAGREARRTYSIIDADASGQLRLGIRVQAQGGLSHHLAREIAIGGEVDTLAPTGRFVYRPGDASGRGVLAVAGGSGITPTLSTITAALARDADSHVVLLYGNRSVAHTMFAEEIFALKNRFMERFAAHFIMSREPQELEIFNGRLDAA